ncbi:sulfatase-like hydrolase/transferase [Natronoarchaeum sp. GCM10025703]
MDAHGPLKSISGFDNSLHDVPHTWTSNDFENWEMILADETDELFQEHLQHYRELYATAIDYLDQKVTQLATDLQENTDDETTVIVTADHGENLGYAEEDRLFNHTASLSEALLHVPCEIINAPSWLDAEYNEVFSHLDLGELITAIARDTPFSEMPHRSHVPAEVIGAGVTNPQLNEKYWDRLIRAVYTNPQTKYVWDSLGDSFVQHKTDDHWEKEDAPIPPEILAQFETDIQEYKSTVMDDEQRVDLDPETESRLEELGYL